MNITSRIKVPGNWEVQGFGTAIYVNHPYEFCPRNPRPPRLPDRIPTGVYSRKFTPEFGAGILKILCATMRPLTLKAA